MTEQEIDWREIGRALAAPFDPAEVDWIVTGKQGPNLHAQVAAYIDARNVQDRLDAVVGPGDWAFEWQPLQIDAKGNVLSAKGILTIHGISKADVGTASNFEASKGSVSDALKRAAVHWGIGRYLYSLPKVWTTLDGKGNIPEDFKKKLADGLRRQAAQASTPAPAPSSSPTPQAQAAPAQDTRNKLAQARTPANDQIDISRRIREAGFANVPEVEAWVRGVIERDLDVVKLRDGASDLTMGECSKLLLKLNERTTASANKTRDLSELPVGART